MSFCHFFRVSFSPYSAPKAIAKKYSWDEFKGAFEELVDSGGDWQVLNNQQRKTQRQNRFFIDF
jgi:hypothetical protein